MLLPMDPRVTFAVTTRIREPRRKAFLRTLVDSIQSQSCGDWRVLVSDDHSPCPLGLEDVRDDRIEVFHQPRQLGMFGGWHFLLEHCETEFFVPMGDDDDIGPAFVADTLAAFSRDPQLDVFVPSWQFIDERGRDIGESVNVLGGTVAGGTEFFNRNIADLHKGHVINNLLFCVAVRTDLMKGIGGYPDYGNPTDMHISPMTARHARRIHFSKDKYLRVRRHSDNASRKSFWKNYRDFSAIARRLLTECERDLTAENKVFLQSVSHPLPLYVREILLRDTARRAVSFFRRIERH